MKSRVILTDDLYDTIEIIALVLWLDERWCSLCCKLSSPCLDDLGRMDDVEGKRGEEGNDRM